MPGNRILRERVAGQSAMSDVVRAQSRQPDRGILARIFGRSPLGPESRAAYRGALAEVFVGEALDRLGQRWDVLHDLPLGESVLDHLVIGPAGVFAAHTTNCSGQDVTIDGDTLLVAGAARTDIRIARADATEVSSILAAAADEPVAVQPLLILVDPRRLVTKAPPSGVRVVASHDLERVLTGAPHTLDGDTVARISDLADLATTWPRSDAEAGTTDTQQLHADFAAIRSQVRQAVGRRILWAAAAAGVVFGLIWGTTAILVWGAVTS